MEKKKILVTFYNMSMGGSGTSLLAFLNCIDKEKYDVDLQLYRYGGELFDYIPDGINILPPASLYNGKFGKIVKGLKFVLKGYWRKWLSGPILAEFQARELSKRSKIEYDYAVGYMEGWADKYLAYSTIADKKYAWLHTTFNNLAKVPEWEFQWMQRVDKVIFVNKDCENAFLSDYPHMKDQTMFIENILDSTLIQKRSLDIDTEDVDYKRFADFDGFKIITVCRIDIQIKGLDRVLKCAKYLKEHGCRFVWCIVGGGEGLNQLKEMVAEHQLQDVMWLVDTKTNPCPYVAAADIYCMPSRVEGKPMTVTESKILGVPAVVTEYLSAHEQINSGMEGIVVENTDDAIIPVLSDLIENPQKVQKMKDYLSANDYGNREYMRVIEKNLFD